jgi:hypothetical protein
VAHRRSIARKVAGDRVISTVDPQDRHVRKTVHHRRDGLQGPRGHRARHRAVHRGRLTQAYGEDNHEAVIGLELLDDKAANCRCWATAPTAPVTPEPHLPARNTPRSSNRPAAA